jgi:hypothetical protein
LRDIDRCAKASFVASGRHRRRPHMRKRIGTEPSPR